MSSSAPRPQVGIQCGTRQPGCSSPRGGALRDLPVQKDLATECVAPKGHPKVAQANGLGYRVTRHNQDSIHDTQLAQKGRSNTIHDSVAVAMRCVMEKKVTPHWPTASRVLRCDVARALGLRFCRPYRAYFYSLFEFFQVSRRIPRPLAWADLFRPVGIASTSIRFPQCGARWGLVRCISVFERHLSFGLISARSGLENATPDVSGLKCCVPLGLFLLQTGPQSADPRWGLVLWRSGPKSEEASSSSMVIPRCLILR